MLASLLTCGSLFECFADSCAAAASPLCVLSVGEPFCLTGHRGLRFVYPDAHYFRVSFLCLFI